MIAAEAGALSEWAALQQALVTMGRPPACASRPAAWFPDRGTTTVDEAVAACSRCPVERLCAAYAVAAREPDGIWGGTTPDERRTLRGAA